MPSELEQSGPSEKAKEVATECYTQLYSPNDPGALMDIKWIARALDTFAAQAVADEREGREQVMTSELTHDERVEARDGPVWDALNILVQADLNGQIVPFLFDKLNPLLRTALEAEQHALARESAVARRAAEFMRERTTGRSVPSIEQTVKHATTQSPGVGDAS